MKKPQSIEKQESPKESTDAATRHAEEAANTKAEELRAALQSKSEQGQSSLGSVPLPEDKKGRKRHK
jgi:hypothetical protein